MGTRHLTMVILDGKVKVAQYGQWDGYPEGQGKNVVNFILHGMKELEFKNNTRNSVFITDDELNKRWKEITQRTDGMANLEEADKFKAKYPQLYRDMGSGVLKFIQESRDTVELQDKSKFAADSLFCEFAYVLDMDNNILEVYEGFNKRPLKEEERFYYLQKKNMEYYPVKLLKKYPFNELTDTTMDVLSKELNDE